MLPVLHRHLGTSVNRQTLTRVRSSSRPWGHTASMGSTRSGAPAACGIGRQAQVPIQKRDSP